MWSIILQDTLIKITKFQIEPSRSSAIQGDFMDLGKKRRLSRAMQGLKEC